MRKKITKAVNDALKYSGEVIRFIEFINSINMHTLHTEDAIMSITDYVHKNNQDDIYNFLYEINIELSLTGCVNSVLTIIKSGIFDVSKYMDDMVIEHYKPVIHIDIGEHIDNVTIALTALRIATSTGELKYEQ